MIEKIIEIITRKKNYSDKRLKGIYSNVCGIVGIILNIFLFIIKLIAGLLTNSISIISDAFNNISDAITVFINMFGIFVSKFGAGEHHPFGHGRMEWLTGLITSMLVIITGITLVKESLESIIYPETINFNATVLIILLISILLKLYMYKYNKKIGTKYNLISLKATAQDCIGDSISTMVILISTILSSLMTTAIGGRINGICGLLVSLLIIKTGYDTFKEIADRILGNKVNEKIYDKIMNVFKRFDGITDIKDLMIYDYGYNNLIITAKIIGNKNLESTIEEIIYQIYQKYGYKVIIEECKTTEFEENKIKHLISKQLYNVDIEDIYAIQSIDNIDIYITLKYKSNWKVEDIQETCIEKITEILKNISYQYRPIINFKII